MGLNIPSIAKVMSFVAMLLGVAMIPSAVVSVIYGEYMTALTFALIIVPLLAAGAFISSLINVKVSKLKLREGIFIVAASWIFASLLGCIPYLATDSIHGFVNAFFESVAGFTTTGATIITDVESLSKGILFWRSFSQWLGGMGILVFAISILPSLGISGQYMAKAETPGINLSKVVPRMSDSAKILYIIYTVFTLSAIILLKFGGLSLFDSAIVSMGSVASGGLSNYNAGIPHFKSVYVEFIAASFTILSCVNYTLYYSAIRRRFKEFFSNSELRVFLIILFGSGLLISANLWWGGNYESVGESLRHGLFQSSSFMTTAGHYSANFDTWPTFSKMLLFMLMIMGASSASTGGGIKVIRVIILFKLIRRGIFMRLHPNAVMPVKIQDKTIASAMVSGVVSFLSLYVVIFFISMLILSLENFDFITTITAVASTLNNSGMGMELIGPTGSYAIFPTFSKIYMSFLMLLGRLELFTILLILTPSFWNPDR
ncbi:TrkH family potassium uptake protein [Bacillota bacterium]